MEKEKIKIPKHIGINFDGSREWALERNLPENEGYIKAYQKLKLVPDWFFNQGVEIISAFVFPKKYWQKDQSQVNFLMKFLKKVLKDDLESFKKKDYRLSFSGRIDEFPGDLPEICQEAIFETRNCSKGILNLCLNYSGRAEIVDAIKKIIKNKIEVEQIHEGIIQKYLYHGEFDGPQMILCFAGKKTLADFLLWGSAETRFMFFEKFWPDFERADVEQVINQFNLNYD